MRVACVKLTRAVFFIIALIGVWQVSPAAWACVPGSWVNPAVRDLPPELQDFDVHYETEHFTFRWRASSPNLLASDELPVSGKLMEDIWGWLMSPPVSWPEPFCDTAAKYKVQVFMDESFGMNGSGIFIPQSDRVPAFWVHPGAFRWVMSHPGSNNGVAHEFMHSVQFVSRGFRTTDFGGWFWENHAEFMAHAYPGNENKLGSTIGLVIEPHLYWGTTRDRYNHWTFLAHLRDKYGYGIVNDLFVKTDNIYGQDPIDVLMRNNNWSLEKLGDEFGEYAMKNVGWDYKPLQDGTDLGAVMRDTERGYGRPNDRRWPDRATRLATLEPIDRSIRLFSVASAFAPQRYGYNLVRLVPDPGVTSFKIAFEGHVQNSIRPDAEYGTRQYEPGYQDWANYTVPKNPGSNWRWGVVAIDSEGRTTHKSAMMSGKSGELTFSKRDGDADFYLVVAAAPDVFHPIFWDQKYHTIYRFPYSVKLSDVMPEGWVADPLKPATLPPPPPPPPYLEGQDPVAEDAADDPERLKRELIKRQLAKKQADPVTAVTTPSYDIGLLRPKNPIAGDLAGHFHPNGGGFVGQDAIVDSTVYVGPQALVIYGEVRGKAKIVDQAVVWDGRVLDNAIVGGATQLTKGVTVRQNAQVCVVRSGQHVFGDPSVFSGNSIVYGDLESYLNLKSPEFPDGLVMERGAFTGFIGPDDYTAPARDRGDALDHMPREVTQTFPNAARPVCTPPSQ